MIMIPMHDVGIRSTIFPARSVMRPGFSVTVTWTNSGNGSRLVRDIDGVWMASPEDQRPRRHRMERHTRGGYPPAWDAREEGPDNF